MPHESGQRFVGILVSPATRLSVLSCEDMCGVQHDSALPRQPPSTQLFVLSCASTMDSEYDEHSSPGTPPSGSGQAHNCGCALDVGRDIQEAPSSELHVTSCERLVDVRYEVYEAATPPSSRLHDVLGCESVLSRAERHLEPQTDTSVHMNDTCTGISSSTTDLSSDVR